MQTIEGSTFSGSSIESFTFPPRLVELKQSWCKDTPNLNNIIVSPDDPLYLCVDGRIFVIAKDLKQMFIDLSISKGNLNEIIEISEKLEFNSKLNGTIQPSVFECCFFLNHYRTYLQYTAYHGSVNVFNYLIEKEVDRTVCDHKKRRIENYSIAGGCKEIIDTVFKIYFNDVSQNKIPSQEIQRHEEDNHSRHESSKRKRNNPFEIGAERTFTSCSNRV